MPATEWGWLITPAELKEWIFLETGDMFVVNKPPFVVCHPSKRGPWSSLIGACREYYGLSRLHMPSRLDRETSGVVIFAKNAVTASRLQRAIAERRVQKVYRAVLYGELGEAVVVRQPIGRDSDCVYRTRQCVTASGGQEAQTEFLPIAVGGGYTLAEVRPLTGRLHQIRVHAAWLGHPVVGDKLYPDATFMLEFVTEGFTPRLSAALPLPRHALHALTMIFDTETGTERFDAPMAEDLEEFCRKRMPQTNIEGIASNSAYFRVREKTLR
jgi:23S rRNA pseudouridine1911/1915/1917 synthase